LESRKPPTEVGMSCEDAGMTLFLAVLGPVLGLAGVLVGLWVGDRRAKRDALREDAKIYREKLVATYLELWDVVEDIHIRMRESALVGITATSFSGLLADVNNFMIRRGAFIERSDRYLVLEYLFWMNEYVRQLAADPRGAAALMSSLAHPELPGKLNVLEEVERRANDLRDQLRESSVGGGSATITGLGYVRAAIDGSAWTTRCSGRRSEPRAREPTSDGSPSRRLARCRFSDRTFR
jgi:hypothetical protein